MKPNPKAGGPTEPPKVNSPVAARTVEVTITADQLKGVAKEFDSASALQKLIREKADSQAGVRAERKAVAKWAESHREQNWAEVQKAPKGESLTFRVPLDA